MFALRRSVNLARHLSGAAPAFAASSGLASVAAVRCSSSSTVQEGDRVKIHYTGSLPDGEVFDSSLEREPLEFVVGSGRMIPGFDKGVRGMAQGEKKSLVLPPADAYGEKKDEAIFKVPVARLPEGVKEGDKLQTNQSQMVTVVSLDGDEATMDGNHRLAGETLHFEVRHLAGGSSFVPGEWRALRVSILFFSSDRPAAPCCPLLPLLHPPPPRARAFSRRRRRRPLRWS
jgi:FKBP-type peptidyl-prolyl cis-trans isomerase 2